MESALLGLSRCARPSGPQTRAPAPPGEAVSIRPGSAGEEMVPRPVEGPATISPGFSPAVWGRFETRLRKADMSALWKDCLPYLQPGDMHPWTRKQRLAPPMGTRVPIDDANRFHTAPCGTVEATGGSPCDGSAFGFGSHDPKLVQKFGFPS